MTPSAVSPERSWVVPLAVAALASAFVALGVIAAFLPKAVPMAWPASLLVLAALLTVATVLTLSRRRRFAWGLFFTVARWVLVLTGVFAALAVYVFVLDGTPGSTLAVLAAVLVLAAVDVPILVAYSVARYEPVA